MLEDESSSEDDAGGIVEEKKLGKTKATASASRTKNATIKNKRPPLPNVIYIGHLPKHCEERELIGFLKQFGILSQLRLCRSHRTGGSKGYGFAKFEDPEVAAIVADTLNGHLLFQKKIVSHVLAPEQIHQKLFQSKTRTVFQRGSDRSQNGPRSMEKMKEISKRLIEREQGKRDKLKKLGIDYDFPGYEACQTKANSLKEEKEQPIKAKAKKDGTPKSDRKRKHSFEEEQDKSPEATTKESKKARSERKKKKKKKADKDRRKSAP